MEDSVFGEMMTRNKRIYQLVGRCMEWFISCSPGVVVGVPGRSRMVAAPTTLRFTRSWTHHGRVCTHSRIPITFRVNLIMHAGLSIVPALIVTWLHTNCLIILTDANVITACLHYAIEPVTIATAWRRSFCHRCIKTLRTHAISLPARCDLSTKFPLEVVVYAIEIQWFFEQLFTVHSVLFNAA